MLTNPQGYMREYYKTYTKRNEKHNCDCGGKYVTQKYTHHTKTKKHQNWVATTSGSSSNSSDSE